MPARLSQQDVMRTPVAPIASSTTEAVGLFEPAPVVAAPGMWKKFKRGVGNLFKKSSGSDESTDVEAAPAEVESATGVLGAVEASESSSAPTVAAPSTGDSEELSAEEEYAKLSPPEKLAHLYEKLGATDAFLDAIYADADLRAAAVGQGSDTLVGFLAEPTLTDAKVQEAANHFSGQIDTIIAGLSVGSAMGEPVRVGLRRVLPALPVPKAMLAFGARFAHAMTENGGSWSIDNIVMVWDQLAVLPDQDVSDLTVLTTFQAIAGGGGFGPSWEAPDTVNTIQLGEDISDPEFMAHTVRHEVGHAVHAEIPAQINPWLEGEIKFWFYNNDVTGVTQLITELGGFPAKFLHPDTGAETDWDDTATSWVVDMLSTYIGPGSSWDPARASVPDGQGAWQTAWWDAMPDPVKDVAVQSPSHWYSNYANFARGTKGSYFLNYWYSRPFYMSDTAKAVVDATGDDYTAMSEKEFFANAYAEYFKDPAGYSDPTKWGGDLPGGVQDFFKNVIVDRQPYQAPADSEAPPGTPTPPAPSGMAGTP